VSQGEKYGIYAEFLKMPSNLSEKVGFSESLINPLNIFLDITIDVQC
jgi:hypothetical protein